MMDCTIERHYAVGVDFIQEGMGYFWSCENTDVMIIEGNGTPRVLVRTTSMVTVSFELKCAISSPNGDVKVLTLDVEHTRLVFNPVVADPFGLNRSAILATFNKTLSISHSGVLDIRRSALSVTNSFLEWRSCEAGKYGLKIGTGATLTAAYSNEFLYISNSHVKFGGCSFMFTPTIDYPVDGVKYPIVQTGYLKDGAADVNPLMSAYMCNFFILDKKLYASLSLYEGGTHVNIMDAFGSINDLDVDLSAGHTTYIIPVLQTDLQKDVVYHVAGYKGHNDPTSNIETIEYFVDGVATNSLKLTNTVVNTTTHIGFASSYLSIRVGNSADEDSEANVLSKFDISNVRLFTGDTGQIPSATEMKILALEKNNCQLLTAP